MEVKRFSVEQSLRSPGVTITTLSQTADRDAARNTETGKAGTGKSIGADVPFFNPLLEYDTIAKVPVMIFRDPDTGEVANQIPSEQAMKKYREQQNVGNQGNPAHSIVG